MELTEAQLVYTYDQVAAVIALVEEAAGGRVTDVVRCDGDVALAIDDYSITLTEPEQAAVLVGLLPTDIGERSSAETPLSRVVHLHITPVVRRTERTEPDPLGLESIRLLDNLCDDIERSLDVSLYDGDLVARVPGAKNIVLMGKNALETGFTDFYARAVLVDIRRF